MKKFFSKLFSFANDEDGVSLKDIITLVVLSVWVTTIVVGLLNDFSGEKLDQFTIVINSVTELTVYIVVSTLGLVATQNIASIFGKRNALLPGQKSSSKKEKIDLVEEPEKEPIKSVDII